MFRFVRVAVLLCLGLFASAAFADSPTPMLWKVSKGDSTVYLLGSMHYLKDSDYPLSADVQTAYRNSEKLVFEIAPAELLSPLAIAQSLLHGTHHDGKTLQDDLSPDTWQKLVEYGEKNGLAAWKLKAFEPWLASLTVVALESAKIGMTADSGLDMHFIKMAEADHKLTSGFETVDQQLAIFYDTPIKDQSDMLKQSLDEIGDFQKEMNKEHDIWHRGDGDTMAAQAKKEYAKYPALYVKLIAQRNRNWIPQIEKILTGGHGHTLVIVGALHLAGPDGVVSLLRQDGYNVERICTGCSNVH